MKRSPEAKAYARRMFRVCTMLAAVMLLLTLYWWLIGDGIWSIPAAIPEEIVTSTSAVGFFWGAYLAAEWMWFWHKAEQERETEGDLASARTTWRVGLLLPILQSFFDGFGWDTVAALLPCILFALPLELCWRHFARMDGPAA